MFIKMCINIRTIAGILFILGSMNVAAAILDKDEADNADFNALQDETTLFQSIGVGIALSIAQCELANSCSLIEISEVETLLNTLELRIESLVLRQEEDADPAINEVLTAYIDERDNYNVYLQKLESIINVLDSDSNLLDESTDLESVESAMNDELLDYLNELEAFEDDELEDDEDLGDFPDLPELE